ncbi:MAG: hypothetical protein JRG71_00580 [Deltaproteobacteria bacterium]|nr:hypothetical protein [Deltaproteobacteria bacterium]
MLIGRTKTLSTASRTSPYGKGGVVLFIAVAVIVSGWLLFEQSMLDADDMYSVYFSEYKLNEAAQGEVMTELKLLANYLRYQQLHGDNFPKLIATLQHFSEQQLADTTFRSEMASVKRLTKGRHTPFNGDSILLRKSGFSSGFTAFLEKQQQLVNEYHLPYFLPNSALQLVNLHGLQHTKERLNHTEIALSSPPKPHRAQRMSQLKGADWHSGDILLAHNRTDTDTLQGYYNHAGIYSEQYQCIIDAAPAMANFSGGVRKSDWSYWADNYTDFTILRFSTLPTNQQQCVEAYVLTKLDEPYNLCTYKKNATSGWYCSKLIYLAYLSVGIDLDIKRGITILPDELALNERLTVATLLSFGD